MTNTNIRVCKHYSAIGITDRIMAAPICNTTVASIRRVRWESPRGR